MAIEHYNWDDVWRRVTGQPHPSSRTANTDADPIDWETARYHAQIFDHNAAASKRTQALRQDIRARAAQLPRTRQEIAQLPRTQQKLQQTIAALHEGERQNPQPPSAAEELRNPAGAESALPEQSSKRAMASQLRELTQQHIIPAVDYAALPAAADYAELSQYRSTAHGEPRVNLTGDAYTDTGYDDITYDVINRNPSAQLRAATQRIYAGGAIGAAEGDYLKQLTDDEIGIFNYLYAQDTAAGDPTHYRAYRYIDEIKPELTARAQQQRSDAWENEAAAHPVKTSLFSAAMVPLRGAGFVGQAVDLLDDDEIDPNAGYNLFGNVSGDIRGTVSQIAEDKWGKPGSFLYNTAMSMADFLTATLISGGFSSDAAVAGLGRKLALGIMASGAAADATAAAKSRGIDDQDAFALGAIAGAAEILTERYSIDALLDPKWSDGAVKYIAKNALTEGSEEVASDLVNTIADLLVSGNRNEINQAMQSYIAQGYSDSEAFGLAVSDKALELGLDFAGGALSGSVSAAGRVAVGTVAADAELRRSGKALRQIDDNAGDMLVSRAQQAPEGSALRREADRLQKKLDNGRTISDYEIGKLYSDMTNYVAANGPLPTQSSAAAADDSRLNQQMIDAPGSDMEQMPAEPAISPSDGGNGAEDLITQASEIEPQAQEHATAAAEIYPPAVQQAFGVIADLADASELTAPQQQMVDAAHATLREYFAGTERTDKHEGQTAADVLHLYGQQRVSAADDAGAVRPLEAGGEPPAGRTSDGRDGNRRQPRLANDRLREAQNRGLMPGSTRELGWADGTNEPRVILYPEDAWDEELQSVATQWRGQGYQVQFVIGPLEFQRDGFEQLADSVVQGNQIAIRANSIRWSAQQLSEHEGIHIWGGQHTQQRAGMLADLQDTLRDAGEPGMRMWSRYAEAYGDAYDGDQDALLEEIAADVWAGINRVGRYADDAVADQLLQVVERYVGGNTPATLQQATEAASPAQGTALDRSNPTRAGPRYSYAGQLSRTADRAKLRRAQEMDQQGVDMDTIRRETGWFTGMDGQWRYEIDDSQMRYRENGDARMLEEPGYRRLAELEQRYDALTDAERAEYDALAAEYQDRVYEPKYLLRDYVQHDDLFEAYPKLNGVSLEFVDLPAGTNGYFDQRMNTIVVSDRLMRAPEETLLHEIQHVIQKIEGFARGASPGYWDERMVAGFDSRTAESKRKETSLRQEYAALRESNPQFVAAMEELNAMSPDVPRGKITNFETLEAEPDPPEWIKYDARRDELESQYGDLVWDYFALVDRIERAAKAGERRPSELYRDTAGEIEARDTANRLDMTDEERMATPPDLGDENTVFAEGGWSTAQDYNPETASIKEQIASNLSTLNAMEIVARESVPTNLTNKRAAAAWVVDRLKNTGYRVDRQGYGEIYFNEKDLNTGARYADTPAEKAALAVLPQVLKRGIEIGGHDKHKNRAKQTITFAAPVELNGVRGNMAVVVNKRGNHYYAHRIVLPDGSMFVFAADIEKDAARELSRGVAVSSSLARTTSAASDDRVASNGAFVKPQNEISDETDSRGRQLTRGQETFFEDSAVRNRQYQLIPVYHATDSSFTTFDRDRLGRNTLGNATDWSLAATSLIGHWFADHDVSARIGSSGSSEYYVNITNPYTTSLYALAEELRGYAADDAAAQEAYDGRDYAPAREAAQAYVEQLQDDGYDGLAVRDEEFGGTSYVVFDSAQAKLTSNLSPSDSPDIRYSLAGDTADGLNLSRARRKIVNQTMNHAAQELRGLISADTRAAREVQQSQLAALARDILQKGSVPQSQIVDAFETIWAAGRQVDTTARDDAADVRDYLRKTGVSLAAKDRADVGDWAAFRRANFGRLRITADGIPVDQAYAELSSQRPDLFPAEIINPADQILRMAEVAAQLRPQERSMDALYGSAAKGQIEASFLDLVDQIQQAFNNSQQSQPRTFAASAEWGDPASEEADALWRLERDAYGDPVQTAMQGFQQSQPAPPPTLDSRAVSDELMSEQLRQTAAKYGQDGRLPQRDQYEPYHLDWAELITQEGAADRSQLEQRRMRWQGEAKKMAASGATIEQILMRTGWYQTPDGEWRDYEQPQYNRTAAQTAPDAVAEELQNEYLRGLTRDTFRGTKALDALDVKIAGSVGNYAQVDQLIANDRAARRVSRDVRRAEKRLRPSPAEMQLARSMADGLLTWDDIPTRSDIDKNTVAKLADYYQMEKTLALDLLSERKSEVYADVDHAVEQLMQGHDAVHVSAAPVMHWRTPRRNLIRMFGRSQGQRMIDYLITPTAANEAERYRWINRQYDLVRSFAGADGESKPLNQAERAAVQLMLEGRAIEEQAAQLEERRPVYNAAEMLQQGKDAADVRQETGLNAELMDIASRLSQWRAAQADILGNSEIDNDRVEAAVKALQDSYAKYYDAINDFLAAHGYQPIGFIKGYAPHLQPEAQQSMLQKVLTGLGLNDQVATLPANIAGLTQQFRPNKRWNPYFLTRRGSDAKLDAIEGFESYVDYLSDIFYHMDDTIRARRMSNYFRRAAAADDIHEQISQAEGLWRESTADKAAFLQSVGALPDGAALSKKSVGDALQNYISGMYESLGETGKYSDLVNWLEDYANQLTAKQYVGDRGFEVVFGRKSLNLANQISNAFQRANVAGNLSTVLNQGSQIPIILADCGTANTIQAIRDIASGKLQRDDFITRSDFLTGKAGIDRLTIQPGDKTLHLLFAPAEAADTFVSSVAARAAYIQAVRNGMSDDEAMRAADLKAEQIMGSRMRGSRPQAFRSKNPVIRMLNMFQLEALNTLEYYEQDTIIQEFRDIKELDDKQGRRAAIAALVSSLAKLMVGAFVLNRITEEIYGGTPAQFDFIGLAISFLGAGRGVTANEQIKHWINGAWTRATGGGELFPGVSYRKDAFDWGAASSGLIEQAGSDLPLVRNMMGILGVGDQSMPMPDLSAFQAAAQTAAETGLSWDTGRDIFSALAQVVPGGRQLSKTFSGAEVMLRGGKWRGDRLMYPVEDEISNWLQALLFGPNGLEEQRGYYAGGAEGLSASETDVYRALTEAGMSRTDAYEQMLASHDLTPEDGYQSVRQIQKWEMLASAGISDAYLYAAVASTLPDDQKAKLDTAMDYGATTADYVAWRRQRLTDGGKTQDAMTEWLQAQPSLSNEARAALWQLTAGWKPDNNPFSASVGKDIYSAYNQ